MLMLFELNVNAFFFMIQVRNVPQNISIAAECIAKIKGIPVEEVIEVTTKNALKLFPKLQNFLQK